MVLGLAYSDFEQKSRPRVALLSGERREPYHTRKALQVLGFH
jgi:hypothetical protein